MTTDFVQRAGDLEHQETSDRLDVKFKLRVLTDLLTCSLCSGFFCDAATVKECLHTFCRSCILFYYQQGGRICPLCKEKFVGSNFTDAIQSDSTIQNIVDRMMPGFLVQEQMDCDALTRWFNNDDKCVESCSSGDVAPLSRISSCVDDRKFVRQPSINPAERLTAVNGRVPVAGRGIEASVEFAKMRPIERFAMIKELRLSIRLSPSSCDIPPLPRPFIKVSLKMTVNHLCRYIAGKLRMADSEFHLMELSFQDQILSKPHSLEFVCRSRRVDPSSGVHVFKYSVRGDDYCPLSDEEVAVWKCSNLVDDQTHINDG